MSRAKRSLLTVREQELIKVGDAVVSKGAVLDFLMQRVEITRKATLEAKKRKARELYEAMLELKVMTLKDARELYLRTSREN